MKDKTVEIFEDAPVPKAVFVNIIPSVISMLMVLIYNLADTFFISQTKNAYMVAAVALATPAFLFFMAVGMLFGIGGTSLISRMLGEGRRQDAKHACSFCFWTGTAVGIAGMAVILLAIDPVAKLVGATPDTMEYVKQYLMIVAIGVPFLVIGNIFSTIIRAEGKANKAMAGMILGNVANIVLDPVMILLFGWNVAGAAVATVIGNILSAVFYIIHFLGGSSILTIHPKYYRAGKGIAAGVFSIGIPASLNSILMSTSNVLVNKLMVHYGDMAVSLSLIMTVICYLGAGPMVNAFLEQKDAYSFGMQFARTLILSGPILGVLFVLINTIQSMGAAIPSLILSISRQGLLYIPVLFLFNKVFSSARMLVMAQPVTDYLAVILSFILAFFAFGKYFEERKEQ